MADVQCVGVCAVVGSSVLQFLKRSRTSLAYLSILIPGLVFAQAQMSTPGSFAVSSSGAATYTIPLQVPPGTAGMQPSLALSYNSQAGNGLAGMGWSLSGLSAIHRCPATIVQGDGYMGGVNYDANDRFCLDGERLVRINTGLTYGAPGQEYRTEHESFTKVVSVGGTDGNPAYFRAWAKGGQIMEFGNTEDSRVQASTQPRGLARSEIRLWAINQVADRAGNYLSVTYYEDQINGIHVPTWIGYSGNSNTGVVAYAGVQPIWQVRPDPETFYEAGSQIYSYHRLANVKTFTSPSATTLVKSYNLTYEAALSPSTNRSRLQSVKECVDAAGSNCLNPTTFAWQNGGTGGTQLAAGTTGFGSSKGFDDLDTRGYVDVNGDGKVDFCRFEGAPGAYFVYCTINLGSGGAQQIIVTSGFTSRGYFDDPGSAAYTDVNGDGKADFCRFEGNPGTYQIACTVNLGTGGPQQTLSTTGFGTSKGYDYPGTRGYVDVNGDGRTDFCRLEGGPGAYYIYCTVNLGSGGSQQIVSTSNLSSKGYDDAGTRAFVDANGDGKADFCRFEGNPGTYQIACTVNLGTGGPQQTLSTTGFGTSKGYDYPGARGYTDVNGDGRTDFCRFEGSPGAYFLYCTVNLGSNGTQTIVSTSNLTSKGYDDVGTRAFVDANGDGKADFCRFEGNPGTYQIACTVNLGTGGPQQTLSTTGFGSKGHDFVSTRGYVDANGDGKPEFCRFEGNLGSYQIWCSAADGSYTVPDLMLAATNGLGVQTTITYKPLTDASVYSKGVSASPPYLDVQAPMYVVSNTSSSNGVGGTRDLRYFYYAAIARLEGGGMMGFGAMQVYDDLTSTIQTSWSRTDWPYQGFVYASQSQTLGGVLLSRTDSNLAAQNTYPGVYFSYPSSTAEKVYVANNGVTGSTLVNTVTTTTEFSESPQYGNPKKITVTDAAGYTKTSVNNYTNDTTNWILGRLTCAAVTSTMPSGATQTRTSDFSYNASGFLATETVEPGTTCAGALGAASTDANLRVTTSYTYDAFGNKQSATVSGGVSATNSYVAPRTTYSYFEVQGNNPAGRFPTRVVNAMGQAETHEFDSRFGAMTKLTGPNGVATSWAYDAFGRKASETRADGTSSTWSYAYYSSTWIIPVYRIITATTGAPFTDTYFDKLNRSVRSYVTHFDGVRSSGSGVDYDSLGRVAIRYRNFLSDATSFPATTPAYDILGRVTAETGPDGSTASFSYNGLTTTVTRSTGRGTPTAIASTTTVNSQGQKLSVTDAAGTITSYTYDPFGNLLTTNAGGVVTSMAYNLRGFKTSMNDPDMGVWSYEYSALGQLKKQTDAKLQVTSMTYDILGRLTNRSEPSLISNWYYDAYKGGSVCTAGKGKLCQVESNNGYNRTYTYDALGRATEVAYTIDDLLNPYRITTTYGVAGDTVCPNSQGKVCTVTYPAATVSGVTSRFAVKSEYNAIGYLAKIWRKDVILTKPYWTGTAMNADGNFTGDSMGASAADLTTVRDFDPLTGRLKAIKSGLASATAAQFNRYVYDHLGNVTERHDDNMNVHETFTLDALSRLTQMSMTGTTAQTKTYQYNAIGNLTYKSDLGTLTYPAIGSPRPHGVTSIAGNATGVLDGVTNGAYTYDANGNMASSVQVNRIYTYTSFNLPSRIFNSNSTSDFIYDADHNRISESYVNGTIIFINPGNVTFFERHKNFNQAGYEIYRFFVHTPSGATIFFSRQSNNGAQAVRFQLKDNLGSTVADVDATGNVVTRYSFDAFGKVRNPNGSATGGTLSQSRRGFTGHEHISVGNSGLIHMNGRVYDATLGRFTTADPFVQSPSFSQSYNRYTYGFNNPLSGTDPSGFGWFSEHFKSVNKAILNPFNPKNVYGAIATRPHGSSHDRFMMTHSWARAIGYAAAGFYGGPYATAFIAGYEAYITGGSNSDIFRAAGIAYFTAEAFNAVGGVSQGVGGGWGAVIKVAGHAAIGCGSAEASGGNCGQGALATGFGAAATVASNGNFVITVIAGGIGAELGGGKFANGALSASMGYLFNHCRTSGNCLQAFEEAASMAIDWASGSGSDVRVFGPGSTQVTDMMDAPGVNGARDFLYKKNATSVTNYSAGFGLIDFLTTSSPTQQFVGSYRVDVFTVNQGADLMFVLNNNSSFQSFGYGVAPAWERGTFAHGGNMRQTYWWTEPRRP